MDLLVGLQRWINASITADLSAFAATRDWFALLAVLPFGIAFGAVHALTPGHGKTVLASYLVGSRLAVLRALAVAGTLALTHVGSAVVLALAAAPVLTRTLGGVGRTHEHREGIAVGIVAGLVPCPLTLFAMFLALSRGVPEAGLTFALAMVVGVGATLALVATATVLARKWVVSFIGQHGRSIDSVSRLLEGLTGVALVAIGLRELLR